MCCSDLFTWTIRWIINGLFSTIKISGFNDFYEMRERLTTIFKSNQQPRDTSSEQDYRIYENPQPFAVDAYNARLCSNTHLPPLLPPNSHEVCIQSHARIAKHTSMAQLWADVNRAPLELQRRDVTGDGGLSVAAPPIISLIPIRCSKEPTRC